MMVCDIDEDGTEENGFEDFPIEIGFVKVEDFRSEIEESGQPVVLNGPSANNKLTIRVSELLTDPVKHEPEDIKIEMNGMEADHDESALPFKIQEVVPSNKKLSNKLRQKYKTSGRSYTSNSGRIYPAREVKPSCGTTCKIQCRLRVPEEVRQQLLENLLRMTRSNQWKFLNDHICVMPVTKSRSLDSRRTVSNHYFLPVQSRLVKVCKTMFVNTYDLQHQKFAAILSKKIGDKHVVCGNPNFPSLLKKGSRFIFDYHEGCDETKAVPQAVEDEECKCDLQCWNQFPQDVIRQIQSSYRENSNNEKNEFFYRHVQLWTNKGNRFKSKLLRARFFLPIESTVKEVCRKMFMRTLKLNTTQVSSLLNNLPENRDQTVDTPLEFSVNDAEPGVDVDGLDERILPDSGDESQTPSDLVRHEPEDIKVELKTDHDEVVLPSDDDSVDEESLLEPEVNDGSSTTDSQTEILFNAQERASSSKKPDHEIRRERKTRGLSYTSSTGSLVPARAVKPNCGAACKIQCRLRVPEEVRQQLLTNLLQLSQANQWKFIYDHICSMAAIKPRSLAGRTYNHYFLPVESRLVKVCKTMFINTYDLPKKRLDKIFAKKIGEKHVVCGNPNFPLLLKKGSKFFFDYNEGYDQAVEVPKDVPEEGCKCELECGNLFREEYIEQLHSRFQEKSTKLQHKFLYKHVQLCTNKKNRFKITLYNARFFLPTGSTVEEVCRKMFLSALKLSSCQVRTILTKLSKNPDLLLEVEDPLVLVKDHIAKHRMEEDHHCAVSGATVKLSCCPNVARMYSEYLEVCQDEGEPIDYQQYYAEFSNTFANTGLLLPTKCPDCGFYDRFG